MRLVWSMVILAVLGALVLAAALTVSPESAGGALDVFFLYVGGLALLGLVVFTGRRGGEAPERSPFEEARRPVWPAPGPLPELERITRALSLGTQSAFDYHFRLQPLLREITETRLAARGRRLEDAERMLGSDAWELVRPSSGLLENRHGPGADPEAVRRLVEGLEKI
jgi:hypothetical protein